MGSGEVGCGHGCIVSCREDHDGDQPTKQPLGGTPTTAPTKTKRKHWRGGRRPWPPQNNKEKIQLHHMSDRAQCARAHMAWVPHGWIRCWFCSKLIFGWSWRARSVFLMVAIRARWSQQFNATCLRIKKRWKPWVRYCWAAQ